MQISKLHVYADPTTACGLNPDINGWPDGEACVHPDGWFAIPRQVRCKECDRVMRKSRMGVPVWTIYNNPLDFPGKVVCRRHVTFGRLVVPDAEPLFVTEPM